MSLADSHSTNDIAIVGLGLHLPDADTPLRFWQNLRDGVESVRRFSDAELAAAGVSPELIENPNYVKAGVVLDGLEMFDAEFFGLSPKEAAIMDPQHRHFLECAWEAMESAGHTPEKFDGRIGVFAGCGMGAYFAYNLLTNADLVRNVGLFLLRHTGNDKDFLATRVSYCFDLRGPSVNIQTACSTSLVAIHTACQSLLSGECDMALAGGVTIELPHGRGYLYKKNEILSPDGHCRAFDHRSQGTIFGSGAGCAVLRRLADAEADGDHIFAVVKGSAVNNDGAGKVGYFAPSVDGQAAAVAEALAVADVEADTIGYVECHGTGTPIGDPIEIAALTQAFRGSTDRKGFCAIGSVKSNIGHLDTAAGVVGLAKAALALEHEQLPPTLNYEAPNPSIDFANSPFRVNDRLTAWPRGKSPRRAGITSLGVGGTNAHVVLEEAPLAKPNAPSARKHQILMLSARNRAALDDASRRLAEHLREHPEQQLADVAYTLYHGRKEFEHRRVVVAADHAEAAALLESGDANRVFTHKAADAEPSIVFMFPGGGAQYPRMGCGLYAAEPVYRQWIDRGLEKLRGKLDLDLRELWFAPPERDEELAALWLRPSIQLPAIFLCEYALAQLWMSWGVKPAALVGHSLGENTAAALAGVLSFDDALGLVTLRGKLFERVAPGGMLSVPLKPDAVEPLLGEGLDLATVNAPEFCTVSGPIEAIDALEKALFERGVEAKRVPIRIAAHSRMLAPVLAEFEAYLRGITLRKPTIPIVSNRTGKLLADAEAVDPRYWVEHLRRTVRFADCVGTLLDVSGRMFLEVGPGKVLGSFARQHRQMHASQAVLASLRHPKENLDDHAFFLTMLGRVWSAGAKFDDSLLWKNESRRRVPLPTYAFQRGRYWIDPPKQGAAMDAPLATVPRIDDPARWFYRPAWKLRELDAADEPLAPTNWLVFVDDAGLGMRLIERLRAAGHEVATVRAGDAYCRHSESEYTLSAEHGRDGYEALLRDLAAAGKTPSRIVHLWLTTADDSHRPGSSFFHRVQEQGFYSLLFLSQALAGENLAHPLHIDVVTNGMAQTRDEALPHPEKATVLGPIGVVPRELAGVTCTAIDVELPKQRRWSKLRGRASLEETIVESLLAEVTHSPRNRQVALRNDRRYELAYERALETSVASPIAIRPRGTYLITGGLGGIGLVLAEHLARNFKAKLVLVGRSSLPPVEEWDLWLRAHAEENEVSRKIRKLQELESYGAEVWAAEADVTDVDAMRRTVAEAKRKFGALHGVVHAAGVLRDNLISLKTQTEIEEVFAPKVYGTLVLDAALSDERLDFLMLFSSTSAAIAPAGQVDYVAANAFLNALAASRTQADRPVVALGWGVWNEIGMAAKAVGKSSEASETREEPVAHPLFGYRIGGLHSPRVEFVGRHDARRHWVYDEHRTSDGQALLPGTGYLELARAALAEIGETGPFELCDLFFVRPLAVADGGSREVRTTLARDAEGYSLEVQSRSTPDAEWESHATGRIAVHGSAARLLDVAALDGRCPKLRATSATGGLRTKQEDHLRFGPRWRVLHGVAYGEGEALGRLELAAEFHRDLDQYALHPALLDLATGFAMHLIRGYDDSHDLWVPVSYKRLRYFAPLVASIVSWVRSRGDNRADGAYATFDVTIADRQGRVLVEIEEFSIKRLSRAESFAVAERELKPATIVTNDDEPEALSPAEIAFRGNLRNGIRPAEGAAAFIEVLRRGVCGSVVVTSLELPALMRQAEANFLPGRADDGAKFERPQLDGEYVEPRDAVERTLVGMWEELLGVNRIGIRDGFFDLGGHSLTAVRLFAQIKKAFHVEFPISVLFEAPTVETCANLIRAEIGDSGDAQDAVSGDAKPAQAAHRYTHLVPMHDGNGGGGRPLFIVAGMFGNVLNLRHLAHLVGRDRPCYGLQARGLYGDHEPHATFEAAAADYLREMRTVQPHGPYLLSGFSGGGLTAYEIAQQLLRDGEEVALLAMLDTPLPRSAPLTTLDKFKIHGQRILRERHRYVANFIAGRVAWEWRRFMRRLYPETTPPAPTQFHSQVIEQAFRAACEVYQPQPYDGRLVLFRPKLTPTHVLGRGRMINADRRFIYHDNGWSRHVAEVEVHEVPGDHDSMVLEPNVRILGTRLRKAIAAAENRLTSNEARTTKTTFDANHHEHPKLLAADSR